MRAILFMLTSRFNVNARPLCIFSYILNYKVSSVSLPAYYNFNRMRLIDPDKQLSDFNLIFDF